MKRENVSKSIHSRWCRNDFESEREDESGCSEWNVRCEAGLQQSLEGEAHMSFEHVWSTHRHGRASDSERDRNPSTPRPDHL